MPALFVLSLVLEQLQLIDAFSYSSLARHSFQDNSKYLPSLEAICCSLTTLGEVCSSAPSTGQPRALVPLSSPLVLACMPRTYPKDAVTKCKTVENRHPKAGWEVRGNSIVQHAKMIGFRKLVFKKSKLRLL